MRKTLLSCLLAFANSIGIRENAKATCVNHKIDFEDVKRIFDG